MNSIRIDGTDSNYWNRFRWRLTAGWGLKDCGGRKMIIRAPNGAEMVGRRS